MLFDSHCHLTDDAFRDDLDAVLERAWAAGVGGIITIASNADDADAAREIAARDPRIRATAGVHPHNALQSHEQFGRIRDVVLLADTVAIGETGLDFHYDHSPRLEQLKSFEWHLSLADETGKPVVVHSRSADDDMIALIRAAGSVRGVLHCFSGGTALFDTALEAGWFISFAGMVTFKNFSAADLVRATPSDFLLIETDSPYLAPIPHRGRRNEPSFIAETAAAIATLRAVPVDDLARITHTNAMQFYRLT